MDPSKTLSIMMRLLAQIINSQTKKIIDLEAERDGLRRQVRKLETELKAKQ